MAKDKIIGITLGDPAGIGPEVIVQALRRPSLFHGSRIVIIGDRVVWQRYSKRLPRGVTFHDLGLLSSRAACQPGRGTRDTAAASLAYLKAAVTLIRDGTITSLVTGPVHKEHICALGQNFTGHTELLAGAFRAKQVEMLFVAQTMRVLLLTRHIPLRQVPAELKTDKIVSSVTLAHVVLRERFGISRPRIAVCGLNPHAGEGGHLGDEEGKIILPAIRKLIKKNIAVRGPYPADTIFSPGRSRNFDLIVAMYHDQGLVGVKTLHFHDLVNISIGLPFIRTSPAHGTAFNIAGKGLADYHSMAAAIQLAAQLG